MLLVGVGNDEAQIGTNALVKERKEADLKVANGTLPAEDVKHVEQFVDADVEESKRPAKVESHEDIVADAEQLEMLDADSDDTEKYFERLNSKLLDAYGKGLGEAFVFKSGMEELKVSKLHLVAQSDFFASLVLDKDEKIKNNTIMVNDSSLLAITHFIDFIHFGKLNALDSGLVAEIYGLADKYAVEELKKICHKRLFVTPLTAENVVKRLIFAFQHNNGPMKQEALEFIADASMNVSSVVLSSEMMQLSASDKNLASQIVDFLAKNSR